MDSSVILLVLNSVFLIPLLVPVGIFGKIYSYISFNVGYLPGLNNEVEHKRRVKHVQDQVKKWIMVGKPKGLKMCSSRQGWKSVTPSPFNKKGFYKIDLGKMHDFVKLDEEKQRVTVEPGIMIGRLSRVLFSRGWRIPVVPELDFLTVGGLAAGTGIESSSHWYGMFHSQILEYEILTADGEVLKCSKETDPDMFHGIPHSYGTLGFLLSVTFPILPAPRYIKLEYCVEKSIESALVKIKEKAATHEFVEGLAFTDDEVVVTYGNVTNDVKGGPLNYINCWHKEFFYKHVENVGREIIQGQLSRSYHESIPLTDYYHRRTRDIFWLSHTGLSFLEYAWFRQLFGWLIPQNPTGGYLILPKRCMRKLTRKYCVQDYVVPMKHTADFYHKAQDAIGIYPVWLCPTVLKNDNTMLYRPGPDGDDLFIGLGFYGIPRNKDYQIETSMRIMERECLSKDGFLAMYADNFIDSQQFQKMFHLGKAYDKAWKQNGCEDAFPHVYDKVSPHSKGIKIPGSNF